MTILRHTFATNRLSMRSMATALLVAVAALGYGQSIKFFTADQGLSSSIINAIYQDHYGIIWIATEDGLNRYDGVKLTVYRNNPKDDHSLAHNYVHTLFEDRDHHLLVGTYYGVQLYDASTDSFSPLAAFDDGFTNNYIANIIQRRNGEIWLAGNRLARLVVTPTGLRYEQPPLDHLAIPTTLVDFILEDRDGNLWLSKAGEGLYRVSTKGKVERYPLSDSQPFFAILCEDMEGRLYGGSPRQGVYLYDRKHDKFLPIADGDQQKEAIVTLFPANANELFIGTDGNGMKVYNNKTHQVSDYAADENVIDIKHAKVHAICKDRTNNYWIALYQKGVFVVPPQRNGFRYWGYKSAANNIIGDCCVTALYRDNAGSLYVGTDNDGLYIIDRNGHQQAHYSHNVNDPHSVPSAIMSIFEDSQAHIWLGAYASGAAWLDPKTGHCTYIKELTDRKGDEGYNVYAFAEDNQQRVWIATMGGRLFSYDLKNDKLTHYADFDPWIDCLYYSPTKNKLFMGTYYGMYWVDLAAPQRTDHVLPGTIVYSLYEHSDGHIWAGTSNGLVDWDTDNDSIKTYTVDDGLNNNLVCAVEGGNDGYLWISTGNGMARFLPTTQQFTNFYVDDGLQGNEFSKNTSWRDKQSGLLYFGGVNGITYFNPMEINTANRKWHIRITDFYLYGRPVHKGMKSGGREIINCPIYEATRFNLSHNDNAFTIEFSTLELDNTDHIVYMYAINEGQWISLPQGSHQVSFSNLLPGTYLCRLKAKDGEVESDVREITIHIAQPWWNTLWAWLGYFAIFIAIAYFIYLQVRHRYLAREERLRLLRAEQANEEKLQFFINISHEIRTPMTLILSPLHQLMSNDTDPSRQHVYHTIDRNAERILSLVNQLMDIRKIDKGQMKLVFRETDVVLLLQDLYDTFVDLATQKNITFTFTHADASLPLWIDIANFDKIILNILSNAFKFTPDDGAIDIALSVNDDPAAADPLTQCAEIVITDSGIGIDVAELERIFDRFYQTRNVANYQGTGVGLHLTRSLVQLHHGVIYAENRSDGHSGSRFIVRLPLGDAHLRDDEKEQTSPSSAPTVPLREVSTPDFGLLTPHEEPSGSGSSSRRRLLIVEDDEEIRHYLRQELSREYYISENVNGKEALEQLFTHECDLVISDIMMPEMDGLTLCRKIKQNIHLNHIPVVLLTARAQEEDNIEGLDTGADAYITKPFNIEVLRHTIKNLIRRREQLRNIYTGSQQTGEEQLEKIAAKSPDDRLMERIMRVINTHLSDPNLTVETIASEVGLSRVHLHRKLKELTNQTTRDFIRNVRMKQAATLLAEKNHSITEVAELVGYTNLSTFSTTFKEVYGMSPKTYSDQQHTHNGNIPPAN